MLWIAITAPGPVPGEARFLEVMLGHGVDLVHLRKIGASLSEYAALLDRLPDWVRERIVIHGHFELASVYGLRGIHLNSRCGTVPEGYSGQISRSCHTLEEVRKFKDSCDYVFLSPVFDSVSKSGYHAAFSDEELLRASEDGTIDSRVVALGGVTPDKLGLLRGLGFGGAAMLGCVGALCGLPEDRQIKELEAMREAFAD